MSCTSYPRPTTTSKLNLSPFTPCWPELRLMSCRSTSTTEPVTLQTSSACHKGPDKARSIEYI